MTKSSVIIEIDKLISDIEGEIFGLEHSVGYTLDLNGTKEAERLKRINTLKDKLRDYKLEKLKFIGNEKASNKNNQNKNKLNIDNEIIELSFDMGPSFEVRRKLFFHYICELEAYGRWDNSEGKKNKDRIEFSSIFQWVLSNHHEYLPKTKVSEIDFTDILQSLESEGCILYYKWVHEKSGKVEWEVVFLGKFFDLPEVKKAKKTYELENKEKREKRDKLKKAFSGIEDNFYYGSEGFPSFPSEDDALIQLSGKTVALGKKIIDLSNNEKVQALKADYEKFERTPKEIDNSGNGALNETIKGNFYIALRVLLSLLDKNIGTRGEDQTCMFRLSKIKDLYEVYGDNLFKDYVSSRAFNEANIKKRMKSSVNALLRWARVGEAGDSCFQIDGLPKSQSPGKENGWYVLKKMKKMSRDGQKTTSDGQKTRGYGKKR